MNQTKKADQATKKPDVAHGLYGLGQACQSHVTLWHSTFSSS